MRAIEATWAATGSGRDAGRAPRLAGGRRALLGLAFLTKMLQAFLVAARVSVSPICCCAHSPWPARGSRTSRSRLGRHRGRAAGGGSRSSSLWPASDRPYIGGSQHNSILELTFGYNGFGRLDRQRDRVGRRRRHRAAACGAAPGSPGCSNGEIGGQIGWLLPAAAVLLVAGGWYACRAPERRGALRAHRLRRLAAGDGADVQPDGRHLPPVLHRRPGAGHRRARRDRRGRAVAEPARPTAQAPGWRSASRSRR